MRKGKKVKVSEKHALREEMEMAAAQVKKLDDDLKIQQQRMQSLVDYSDQCKRQEEASLAAKLQSDVEYQSALKAADRQRGLCQAAAELCLTKKESAVRAAEQEWQVAHECWIDVERKLLRADEVEKAAIEVSTNAEQQVESFKQRMKAKSPTRLRSKEQQEDDNADDHATEAEAGQLKALQLAYDTAYK
eukprot:1902715-Pleurochrysis_carterae.AAC.1